MLATMNGGLTDVTLLDGRTPPDVLDHFIAAGNALRGVGEEHFHGYLKTSIIEEKWHQKRKQEAEERRLQKKRRESTSEGREGPGSQADRVGEASLAIIRTNFDEAFLKFDAFLAALTFHKMMEARGLWEKYADVMRKAFRSTELQVQSTVVLPRQQDHRGETQATLW